MSEVLLAVEYDETSRVLAVVGSVDEESTETLRLAIEDRTEGYTRGLTVDLSGATYLPSVAVGMLARAAQACTSAGTEFELAAASGTIAQRVLTVSAMPHRTY